jgi:ATP-binding cassette, subfamily F, member 3
MIDFIDVTKRFGAQEVLSKVSFRIHPGEHVGVVGPNGAGKSTVFHLIGGDLAPDGGVVVWPKDARLGHLRQQLHAHAQPGALLDYVMDAIPELKTISAEIHHLEHDLPGADGAEKNRRLRRLGDLQHRFEHLGGYDLPTRAKTALSGLGFREDEFAQPFRSFSGGWQMRAEMARTLIAHPDILLLDEPSNYLDLPAVEWLQRFLRAFDGTLLLISHDRYLLQTLTDRTLEIGGGAATRYSVGYAGYLKERALRHQQQEAAYRQYVEQKDRLEQFIRRFRAQATKASQVQSRIKMLEKIEPVPPPPAQPQFSRLRLPPPPPCGAKILNATGLGFSYDGSRWIFRGVDLEVRQGEKIALVGYNGMGKTTLLRVLAGARTPREGELRLGSKVERGYQSQDFAETMPPGESLLVIVRAANPAVPERAVRSLLGSFGFSGAAVEKPSGVLSGGEKIRLAFARIFVRPPNLLLLDEPTTNLDLHGREALERALREYAGTVCFVSHDLAFVRGVADRIWAIGPGGLTRHVGGYDDYLARIGNGDGEAAARGPSVPSAGGGGIDTVPRRRTQRVERAKEREARKALHKMEAEMERLHAEQKTLCGRLAAGEDGLDYAALNKRLSEIARTLNDLEARWMEEADRLGV